ncbi:MAG: NACHT domain-containing protein [Gammaproteobacteria bacterium]|nr:NACHT domain-containing protein [Gammaproteobacteria bacterium]
MSVENVIAALDKCINKKIETRNPVWIELGTCYGKEIDVILARLNERRELLRTELKRPLVIVLPYDYKGKTKEIAPDLWSVREYSDNLQGILALSLSKIFTGFKNYILGLRSGFRRRYKREVIYEHRFFNVRGLRTTGTFTLELEQVFVELRIAPALNPNQVNANPLNNRELEGSRPLWDFLRLDTRRKDKVWAIIGPPGCGKTTLLQHMALVFAANKQKNYKLPVYVPVLLFLRDHVQNIVDYDDKPPPLAKVAEKHFADSKRYPDLKPPPQWFDEQLQAGRCLVMLDGLDEVADTEQRKKVSEWVDDQIRLYPRNPFFVTSRPQGYCAAPLHSAHVLEVQAFNATQVKHFIHAWYLANEITAYGHKQDEGIRRRARQGAEDLLERIRELPALGALTVNPLLLTMIAMVHRYRGQLPGRRVELYAEICDVLLGLWRKAKRIGNGDTLTAAQKRVALQPLAAAMMRQRIRQIDTARAMAIIAEPLKMVNVRGDEVKNFLTDIQTGSGLLLENEAGEWRFAHLSFQEYLAAAHFLETGGKINPASKVNDSWWHETLRLYAAQGDATTLMQACLVRDSVPALTLAADCLEEARKMDGAVREMMEKKLVTGLEADDPERCKLAAQVFLQRRLGRLLRMDEHSEISEFITCAEYQLFLDQMRMRKKYHQPGHWDSYTFPKGNARKPVMGIRGEDAEAFCTWLNQREEGFRYRPPVPEEAADCPSANGKMGKAWCKQEERYSLTWISDREKQRYERDCQNLSKLPVLLEYCTLDLERDRTHVLHTYAHARNLTRRTQDFNRDLNYALNHALALNRTRPRDFAPDRTRAHDLAHARDLDLDLDRDRDRDRAHALALAFDLDFDTVNKIQQGNYIIGQQLIEKSPIPANIFARRRLALLCDVLACLSATDKKNARLAWRRYAAKLAEYTWTGYGELEKLERIKRWWQFWRWGEKKSDYNIQKRTMLGLHWWLTLVNARAEGKLPAWEGIRIVRERMDDGDPPP